MFNPSIPLSYNPKVRPYSPDELATLATLAQQPALNQRKMELAEAGQRNDDARTEVMRQEAEARKLEADARKTDADSRAKIQGQQYELNALKLEEQKRAAENARKIQQVLLDNEGDLERSIPGIRMIDPLAADTFAQHLDTQRKARLSTQSSELDLSNKRAGMLANGVAGILNEKDPAKRAAMYGTTRNALIASGQFKAEDLPEAMPDEPTMRALVGRTLSPQEQTTLPGADGLTPYQRATLGIQREQLAMADRRIRAQEARENKAAAEAARMLRALRAEELKLEGVETTLETRRAQIGRITTTGKNVRDAKSYTITPEERSKLETEYQGLDSRYKDVLLRKQQIAAKRAELQGSTLAGIGGSEAAAAPKRPRKALDDNGNVIIWDEKRRIWLDSSGKPYQTTK